MIFFLLSLFFPFLSLSKKKGKKRKEKKRKEKKRKELSTQFHKKERRERDLLSGGKSVRKEEKKKQEQE